MRVGQNDYDGWVGIRGCLLRVFNKNTQYTGLQGGCKETVSPLTRLIIGFRDNNY